MRRALGTVACVILVLTFLPGSTAWASTSGGTQRWAASSGDGGLAIAPAVVVSPGGSTVFVAGATAYGSPRHSVTLAYDASTGARRWTASYPDSSTTEDARGNALALSPNGSTLFVTGSSWCSACGGSTHRRFLTMAYDASTGTRLWVARYDAQGEGFSIAVSPDGSRLFVSGQADGGEASATVAYDPSTGEQLWAIRSEDDTVYWGGGLSVSPDSSTVYVGGTVQTSPGESNCDEYGGGYRASSYDAADGTVRWSSTWRVSSGSLCGKATSLRMSPDGSTVFVTGYGGTHEDWRYGSGTVAYDALTGRQLWATRDDHIRVFDGDTVIALGVSPDGSQVFVLGNDCAQYPACPFSTVAYDASTGDRQWVSRYDGGGRGYGADLAVSPDGSAVFVTGQEDLPCFDPCNTWQTNAPLVAYNAETGAERWATSYANNNGWALAVSPDSASVYLAGEFTASSSTSSARVGGRRSRCTRSCGSSIARYNTGPGAGRFQDADFSLRFNGWRTFFRKTAIGGAYRASRVRGDTATFRTPKATSVAWLTHRGPRQGKARVIIDGRPKGTFNLYSRTPSARSYTFRRLGRRAHTVQVKVLGRKQAASKGTWVAVDGFKVKVGSGLTQESSRKVRYDSWRGVSRRAASGGSYRVSGSPSARMSLVFKGRSIKWITARGPAYGRARVVIDGKAHTVDLYRRTGHWKAAVSYTGLSKGRHRITVRPLGTKRAASSSRRVVVDAFVVRS